MSRATIPDDLIVRATDEAKVAHEPLRAGESHSVTAMIRLHENIERLRSEGLSLQEILDANEDRGLTKWLMQMVSPGLGSDWS